MAPPRPPPRLTPVARLTLGYAGLFSLSALVLAALTYALLLATMRERDDAYVRATVRGLTEVYAAGGARALAATAAPLAVDDRGEELLIRLVDASGAERFVQRPEDWTAPDVAPLGPPRPGETVSVRHRDGTESLDVVAVRLPDGAALQVGISSDERDDAVDLLPRVFGALALPLVLLALAGGMLMGRRALRPVRDLVDTFEAITATGDLARRAPVPAGRGDVAALFALFNRMLDRIEGLVGGLRETLDHVAHDLRTPLTRLRGTAEVALGEERDPDVYRDALATTLEASDTLTGILDAMMDVAEADAGVLRLSREPVDLAGLVGGVLTLYDLVADDRGVALAGDVWPGLVATVDRRRVQQALANLVDNAVKYTPAGGRVAVTAGVAADGSAWIAVEDTGPGVADADRERIWDRLYRADKSRSAHGLGLGLSVVRAVAHAHGGTVGVETAPGGGARFTMTFPPPAG